MTASMAGVVRSESFSSAWCVVLVVLASMVNVGARRALRIACVGDSITMGNLATPPYQTVNSYPAILQQLLGERASVSNFGAGGRTMMRNGLCEDGTDCSYWTSGPMNLALASNPDVVVLMLGTNDAKDFNWARQQERGGGSFEATYREMIAEFAALRTRPKVFLAVPPPLYPPYPFRMMTEVINELYPQLVRRLANETAAGPSNVLSNVVPPNVSSNAPLNVPLMFNRMFECAVDVLVEWSIEYSIECAVECSMQKWLSWTASTHSAVQHCRGPTFSATAATRLSKATSTWHSRSHVCSKLSLSRTPLSQDSSTLGVPR